MNWEQLYISRLLIAVPEVAWSDELIKRALSLGILKNSELDAFNYWKRQVDSARRVSRKLTGKELSQRLLILAPELISTRSIDLLRRMGMLDETSGQQLRLFIRALTVTGVVPGAIPTNRTFLARLQALSGVLLSNETIDLLRRIPLGSSPLLRNPLSVEEANFLRATLIGAERLRAVRKVISSGGGIVDVAALVAGELLDERIIRMAVLSGAVSQQNARLLISGLKLGRVAWRVSSKVWDARGFEQRALYVATGLFSDELISFLRQARIIDAQTARNLRVGAQMARTVVRTQIDAANQVQRAYRVLAGEAPIATYARTARASERALLEILDEAAQRSAARAAALNVKPGLGAKARAAQERILINQLYGEMRALWEGVGYLTIIGEANAGRAAVDSMDFLLKNLFQKEGTEADLLRRALREQGRAGVDSLISREENVQRLSRLVYKNMAFTNERLAREIQIALVRGLSSKEFADQIRFLISPDVRGGVSYAAQRLARSEINNAFHLTSIRYTREMPWVTGYGWNLSGTHSKRVKGGDVCDDYANEDRHGLGAGIYPKRDVPSKPHPQCLCYITTEVMDSATFSRQYRRGVFNRYIDSRERAGLFEATPDPLAGMQQLPNT